jgi:predicted  nucleic acid-binding Zn-ribbon protein
MTSLNEKRGKLQRELKMAGTEKEKGRQRIQGLKDSVSSLKFRVGEGENKVAAKKNFLRDIEEYKVSVAKSREEVKVHAPPPRRQY